MLLMYDLLCELDTINLNAIIYQFNFCREWCYIAVSYDHTSGGLISIVKTPIQELEMVENYYWKKSNIYM